MMPKDEWAGLNPPEVFRAFAEISAIPRGSGHERAVSDHLLDYARALGLDAVQDSALNVIVKKAGTPGYETAPVIILQGHMDMVWEKRDASPHCFETDPIRLLRDGDRLSARDTTLGADNGIAVAYAMALLASRDIPHPPLEILITTQEEVGLKGAAAVDPSSLSGKILINLDAEQEGQFLVSCAGGSRCTLSLPLAFVPAKDGYAGLDLKVSGLTGGHSGMDIHRGRANANALMGEMLACLTGLEYFLASLEGGAMVNAIPRMAGACVLVRQGQAAALTQRIRQWESGLVRRFGGTDPDLRIGCCPAKAFSGRVMTQETSRNAVALCRSIPTGVRSMSPDIEGLVESSLNFGVISVQEERLGFQCSVRSCRDALRDKICRELEGTARAAGARFETGASYPAWEYRERSFIREVMTEAFRAQYQRDPAVDAIHAGLECGVLGDILGDMDMISVGPTIRHVHTPDEYLSIGSAERTFALLCRALKMIVPA